MNERKSLNEARYCFSCENNLRAPCRCQPVVHCEAKSLCQHEWITEEAHIFCHLCGTAWAR
jgi:hypothetical protein